MNNGLKKPIILMYHEWIDILVLKNSQFTSI